MVLRCKRICKQKQTLLTYNHDSSKFSLHFHTKVLSMAPLMLKSFIQRKTILEN